MSQSETAKLWQERLRRFDRSQLTVVQFCRNEGVSQPSFYQWKKKLRQPPVVAEPKLTDSTFQFMPLRLPAVSGNHSDEPGEHLSPTVASTTIELPVSTTIQLPVSTHLPALPVSTHMHIRMRMRAVKLLDSLPPSHTK